MRSVTNYIYLFTRASHVGKGQLRQTFRKTELVFLTLSQTVICTREFVKKQQQTNKYGESKLYKQDWYSYGCQRVVSTVVIFAYES